MPFGLTIAPAVFQALINDVLRDMMMSMAFFSGFSLKVEFRELASLFIRPFVLVLSTQVSPTHLTFHVSPCPSLQRLLHLLGLLKTTLPTLSSSFCMCTTEDADLYLVNWEGYSPSAAGSPAASSWILLSFMSTQTSPVGRLWRGPG